MGLEKKKIRVLEIVVYRMRGRVKNFGFFGDWLLRKKYIMRLILMVDSDREVGSVEGSGGRTGILLGIF